MDGEKAASRRPEPQAVATLQVGGRQAESGQGIRGIEEQPALAGALRQRSRPGLGARQVDRQDGVIEDEQGRHGRLALVSRAGVAEDGGGLDSRLAQQGLEQQHLALAVGGEAAQRLSRGRGPMGRQAPGDIAIGKGLDERGHPGGLLQAGLGAGREVDRGGDPDVARIRGESVTEESPRPGRQGRPLGASRRPGAQHDVGERLQGARQPGVLAVDGGEGRHVPEGHLAVPQARRGAFPRLHQEELRRRAAGRRGGGPYHQLRRGVQGERPQHLLVQQRLAVDHLPDEDRTVRRLERFRAGEHHALAAGPFGEPIRHLDGDLGEVDLPRAPTMPHPELRRLQALLGAVVAQADPQAPGRAAGRRQHLAVDAAPDAQGSHLDLDLRAQGHPLAVADERASRHGPVHVRLGPVGDRRLRGGGRGGQDQQAEDGVGSHVILPS